MHISHYRSSDEDILDAAQMRVLVLVQHLDIIELDIQVLVDGFQGTTYGNVVLELDGYGVVDEGFEEGEEEHDDDDFGRWWIEELVARVAGSQTQRQFGYCTVNCTGSGGCGGRRE